jgi:hypothetical protein
VAGLVPPTSTILLGAEKLVVAGISPATTPEALNMIELRRAVTNDCVVESPAQKSGLSATGM